MAESISKERVRKYGENDKKYRLSGLKQKEVMYRNITSYYAVYLFFILLVSQK